MYRGKISPPSGIFLLKNWLNYKDTLSFENNVEQPTIGIPQQSREEIAARTRRIYWGKRARETRILI